MTPIIIIMISVNFIIIIANTAVTATIVNLFFS